MVQPFAEDHANNGEPIAMCMVPMDSSHFAEPIRADEYSPDGVTWQPAPDGIRAVGSRFALKIQDLQWVDVDLPLAATEVAVGRSTGRIGSEYVKGRVDKACLKVRTNPSLLNDPQQEEVIKIRLTGKLIEPYAVFLRKAA